MQRPTAPLPVGLVEREFRSPLEWYILVCVGIGGGSDRVAALSPPPTAAAAPCPKSTCHGGAPGMRGKSITTYFEPPERIATLVLIKFDLQKKVS